MNGMKNAPRLTDRTALMRNRARAAPAPVRFLHETALEELQFRLGMVNRTFTAPAIVAGDTDFWGEHWPDARLVHDEEVLALDEGAHDLVIHAMCLHWANDPVGQLIQCRRALKPDGLLLAVLCGGETLHELRSVITSAEVQATGGLSPRVLPMGDIRDLGALLQRSGLALPVADNLTLRASYSDAFHLMRELRAMGEANALADRLRHPTRRSVLRDAAELYAATHGEENGRIPATYELMFLTGWAPDESQPKPLRPGSATKSLADALGGVETPLPD